MGRRVGLVEALRAAGQDRPGGTDPGRDGDGEDVGAVALVLALLPLLALHRGPRWPLNAVAVATSITPPPSPSPPAGPVRRPRGAAS